MGEPHPAVLQRSSHRVLIVERHKMSQRNLHYLLKVRTRSRSSFMGRYLAATAITVPATTKEAYDLLIACI
jgi:hypothetical protein